MDSDCGGFITAHMEDAVNDGTVSMDLVDSALTNLLKVQFRLGMFEAEQPFADITVDSIDTDEHRQLALEASRQGMTLLKNDGVLPLQKGVSVGLLGPHAQSTEDLQGNYYGGEWAVGEQLESCHLLTHAHFLVAPFIVSPEAGLKEYGDVTTEQVSTKCERARTAFGGSDFSCSPPLTGALPLRAEPNLPPPCTDSSCAQGCEINSDDKSGFDAAVKVIAGVDVVVLAIGINQSIEAEGLDRYSISLPGVQKDMIEAVLAEADAQKKQVVMVYVGGGASCLGLYSGDDRVSAIVAAGYSGQSGGTALAEALYGDYSPAGRLTHTYVRCTSAKSAKKEDY